MSVLADVKDWMRARQCFAILLAGAYGEDSKWPTENQRIAVPNCCAYCEVIADRLDVYHCLEPRADISCWNILGDEVSDVDEGPTTNIRH